MSFSNMPMIPFLSGAVNQHLDSDGIFKRELDENFIWFNGRPELIELFFKNLKIIYSTSSPGLASGYDIHQQMFNFWKEVGGDMARVHSGVPALISKTYGNLIKPSSIVIKVLNDEGKEDTANQERLDAILEDNNWHTLSKRGTITESWGGFFFYKLSYMNGFKYPIIEMVDPRQGRAITKRGRIIGYKFSSEEKVNDTLYEIIEKYIFDDKGNVIVEYEVYKGHEAVRPEDVPQELKRLTQVQKLNIDFLPAFLKNNTAHSSKFPDKPYGESDYANSQSLFHMLDSLLSNMELDVDNAKAIQFVNKNIMEFDKDNNQEMYNKHKLRIFLTNKIMDDPDFDINKIIGLFQPEIRIEQFDLAMKDITVRILANGGLSPSSVGMPGYESANASNLSQTARRENSIISRDEKLELWLPFLKDFMNSVLKFDDYINGRPLGEYNVFVEYNKYIAPDLNTLVNLVVKAVNGGVMSLEQAIELMWPDKSKDEKEQLVELIKLEMMERSTRSSNALESMNTPVPGQSNKVVDTGRKEKEEGDDEEDVKELDKYKK